MLFEIERHARSLEDDQRGGRAARPFLPRFWPVARDAFKGLKLDEQNVSHATCETAHVDELGLVDATVLHVSLEAQRSRGRVVLFLEDRVLANRARSLGIDVQTITDLASGATEA